MMDRCSKVADQHRTYKHQHQQQHQRTREKGRATNNNTIGQQRHSLYPENPAGGTTINNSGDSLERMIIIRSSTYHGYPHVDMDLTTLHPISLLVICDYCALVAAVGAGKTHTSESYMGPL